jgi:hypothetical protein
MVSVKQTMSEKKSDHWQGDQEVVVVVFRIGISRKIQKFRILTGLLL